MNQRSLTLFVPAALALATLARPSPAQDEGRDAGRPQLAAPIVISYGAEGLQLTPNLLNGLLQGCVGDRVNARLREGNPDWPRVELSIRQEEADRRQPPGYFSGTLVASSGPQRERVLREAVAVLQDELDARMHGLTRDELDKRRERTLAELTATEDQLNAQRLAMLEVRGSAQDVEVALDRLNEELVGLQMEFSTNEPLIAVEQKHAAELEARMRSLTSEHAKLDADAAELEARAGENPDRSDVRLRLLDLQANRDQTSRALDQVANSLSVTSSSVQERSNRLVELRSRMDVLHRQMTETKERLADTRASDRKRLDLERSIEALDGMRQQRREELAELRRSAAHSVPVRVQLWY